MSGIAKAVKKTFNAVKKVVKTVVKSKVFKAVAVAATVYFGGAALISLANGGTAMAGIGSAWSGVTGAGSALASGNFAAAGSSISAGWSGAATGAGSFAGGQAATSAIVSSAAAPVATTAATSAASSGIAASTPQLAAMHPAIASSSMTPVASEVAAGSGGLLSGAWKGLGEAGKAAVITSGINIGGQMLQGHAAEKEAEEERKRRTYWGVNGDGQGDASGKQMGGLLQLAQTTPMSSFKPGNAPWNAQQQQNQFTPQVQQPPQTLDELIKRLG